MGAHRWPDVHYERVYTQKWTMQVSRLISLFVDGIRSKVRNLGCVLVYCVVLGCVLVVECGRL